MAMNVSSPEARLNQEQMLICEQDNRNSISSYEIWGR